MSVAVAEVEIKQPDISNSNCAPLAKRDEDDDDDEEDDEAINNENRDNKTNERAADGVNDDETLSGEKFNNEKNILIINDSNNNKNSENRSNNNTIESSGDLPQIIQTDEIITVVVSENSSKVFRETQVRRLPASEQQSCNNETVRDACDGDSDKVCSEQNSVRVINEINSERSSCNSNNNNSNSNNSNNNNFPKSILCANNNSGSTNGDSKSLLRKKSVSFEKSDEVKKFIVGEEIIDKQNPFRSTIVEIDDKYRLVKRPATRNGSAPLASEENDFITKEEILKQSKYVPVYVKNPDKVLTYDRAVLERLKIRDSDNKQPRIPVPLPRKSNSNANNVSSNKAPAASKVSSTKVEKKEKKRSKSARNSNYPDLSDIRVKTGTDIDESLYDPNEVVLNAKKFDSRFKTLQFGSTDDLEEIVEREEEVVTSERAKEGEAGEGGEKKSYTNTVNSEEFRQYLKKKGLVLFPIKTSANGVDSTTALKKRSQQNGSAFAAADKQKQASTLRRIYEVDSRRIDTMESDRNGGGGKKKSVFHRLSSIFSSSKGKTMPKSSEPLTRLSYASNNGGSYESNPATMNGGGGGNLSSNIKRVILERNFSGGGDNRSVSANSEFMQLDMQVKQQQQQQQRHAESDDTKSSISSVLTAAADDDVSETPVVVRRKSSGATAAHIPNGYVSANATASMLYRNIDLTKSKLYQSKVRQNNGSAVGEKQQAQPQSALNNAKEADDIIRPRVQRPSNISRAQPVNRSLIKPPVPLRRSAERQSMPVMKSGERYKPSAVERSRSHLNSSHDDDAVYRTPNTSRSEPKQTSTPSGEEGSRLLSPKMSPIVNSVQTSRKPSEIDPITFAKIHEIKKKTDEVLMNKTAQLYTRPADTPKLLNNNNNINSNSSNLQRFIAQQQPQFQQQHFVRNSPQRATITDVYQGKATTKRDDCGSNFAAIGRQSFSQPQQQQPPRSQSVLDNVTASKNSLYGEVAYRRPDGSNVNVLMRRPESTTIDRSQIMQKIYEYYRKSVNNTPVSMLHEKNLQYRTQSTDTSPVSYASLNTASMRSTLPKMPVQQSPHVGYVQTPRTSSHYSDYSMDRKGGYFYTRPPTVSSTASTKSARNQTISESDSVFLPNNGGPESVDGVQYVVVNGEKLRPADVLKLQQQRRAVLYAEPERIYDVVYSSTASSRKNSASENGSGYGNIKQNGDRMQARTLQRPASAMSSAIAYQQQQQRQAVNGRMTPLILHPQFATRQGDIIINNQIYRPISEIPAEESKPQPQQPIYSTPMRKRQTLNHGNNHNNNYESDSEAGEIQSIMQRKYEEDYQNEKSSRNQQNEQVDDRRRSSGRRGGGAAEDPRRHTLGAEMMHYANQGNMQRSLDLEMGQPQKSRKGIPIRAYTPQHQGPLFDDDPGIMSEVETASTGFRRGGKSRSSLPVVRTPSKTLERPLGLVFLQYRSETKRALLPNEITSIDTVRALFVRSFPRQLSMAYLEGPNVKIYIHDSSKDMFYELEDVRSHLREIRDRSVLRLFESNEVAAPQVLPGGPGIPQPLPQQGGSWDHDQSYFSEPEFDSEYQHQHIHKSKTGKAPYYVGAQTLPRGHVYTDRSKGSIGGVPAKPIRSYGSRGNMAPQFSYPSDQLYSIPDGYMSSPERGTRAYEEPYYTQYGTRGSSVTPIIDEEQSDSMLIDDQYSMYGMKRISRNPNQMYDPSRPEDLHRIRVEHMERQLANLTGLVQKALVQNPQISTCPQPQPYIQTMQGPYRNDKSVSFEKSVSFSDDIQGVPKAHSPQHMADSKPPKPAIKSSTLPRTSSQERDRLKPAPPMKQGSLQNQYQHLTLAPEVYNHLRGLQKKTKDLKGEVKTLRRLAQSQAIAVREDIKDTFMRIRATLLATNGSHWGQNDQERTRISREEEIYKQEVIRLEKDLADLEGSVEVLRGEVINRRTRVNMAAVEDMALVLSRASKTVAELKMRFPNLQQNLRNILSTEMERVCREEKFLKEEPDRLEIALRRCKKLTGTLVTLKRLASVQEQRTCVEPTATEESSPRSASETTNNTNKPVPSPRGGQQATIGITPENALDILLDELQTFAKPPNPNDQLLQIRPDESTTSDDSSQTLQNTVTTKLSQSQLYPDNSHQLRRLHSYPSGSDTEESPPRPPLSAKPPVPERNSELLSRKGKKVPPPPPPRTSSRSPLASPTSPSMTSRSIAEHQQQQQQQQQINADQQQFINSINNNNQFIQNDQDSGSESANSQDNNSQRQMQLELRHQELLKKQKALQEQYQRLQQMSKNAIPLGHNEGVKRMGSDTNLAQKLNASDKVNDNVPQPQTTVTTNKVYETDIL